MKRESPQTFFDFFVARYKHAPRMIVYDHACGLLVYCLNRLPWFFRYTQMRCDVLHWLNHIGCSHAFDFMSYKASDPAQYDWNTNLVSCIPRPNRFLLCLHSKLTLTLAHVLG